MDNRFMEMNDYLKQVEGEKCQKKNGHSGAVTATLDQTSSIFSWSRPLSAADRVLVILIENGGIDLGVPALVDKLWPLLPGATMLPDSWRQKLSDYIGEKIRSFTDNLLEGAELAANRYTASKPDPFGAVVVLRDGSASYNDLKSKLISLSGQGKLIDLFILTHGSEDSISVTGGISGDKIRAMKTENGKPLSIRSVYMMNCVGSSLNQAWLDAGAKVSAGALHNNYLPEPTMYFFWQNWKAGQNFETAVTSAYRKTVALMSTAADGFLSVLPGLNLLSSTLDFENMDFVKDSAPVIQGQRSLTITSDDLTFTQSLSSSLATTVLPVRALRRLSTSLTDGGAGHQPGTLSQQGIDLIKSFEGFIPKLYNDPVGHCTVGYGTLLHHGNCDGRDAEAPYANGVTEEKATQLLADEAGHYQQLLNDTVTVALNQNQNDALVSFIYNVGADAFRKSTLLKVLNQGKYEAVPGELKKWTKARQNGNLVDLPGLVTRRKKEAELFQKPVTGQAQSLMVSSPQFAYHYENPSQFSAGQTLYSMQQNPAMIAGIAVSDAIQIGLAGVSVAQAGYAASQGSFTLVYDKMARLLTEQARADMPGSVRSKQKYTRHLLKFSNGRPANAYADVTITWEGNPYGEISTPIIERNLSTSSEWSHSSCTLNIIKVDPIPLVGTDPRTWPIIYHYEGTYDPIGNGYFEFSGEFEINAFGGIKWNKHEVVSRSFADWMLAGDPKNRVTRGEAFIVPAPEIPKEQVDYLKKAHLP
jgi:GH24 family phage-related lysozyme (muramidase)